MKKKILHVIGRRPRGGIGTFLINMVKFDDSNFCCHDFLIHAEETKGEFEDNLSNYDSNVSTCPILNLKSLVRIISSVNGFYRNNDYDLIHVHSPVIFILHYFIAKLHHKNVILGCHSHSTKYSDSKLNSIRNWFLHLPIRHLSEVNISCSRTSGDFLFGKKKFSVINNAIDVQRFRFREDVRKRLRKEYDIDDKFVIGHVGAFFTVKNQMFILDFFYELSLINSKAVLVLIGDGELENECKAKAESLDIIDKVYFLGRRNNVEDFFMSFDCFVMPSLFEGVPLVGVEAQASGLPCVFSDSITSDIDMSGRAIFVSLSKGKNYWSRVLNNINTSSSPSSREIAFNDIIESGYDIKSNVSKLIVIYREKLHLNV
ncbi:glycosyltransferase [Vibrio splendidus]